VGQKLDRYLGLHAVRIAIRLEAILIARHKLSEDNDGQLWKANERRLPIVRLVGRSKLLLWILILRSHQGIDGPLYVGNGTRQGH
jgi:hypothetical protein